MDWRYASVDRESAGREELFARLFRLFQELLLRTSGDVEEALGWLEQLAKRHGLFAKGTTLEDFRNWLEARQSVERDGEGALVLSKKGEREIRASSLDLIFGSLERDVRGDHRVPAPGTGLERLPETRPWEFGDPLSLVDPTETLANAIRRTGVERFEIGEEDLRVSETEHLSSCATVLMIDVSHSMVLYGEDRITPAKRVALALCELITTRYPKDSLDVVLFGDEAWQVSMAEIPYLSAGPYHTNTRAGLQLARGLLRKKRQANRQIFMLTDGKPSALTEHDGEVYKNPFGLDRRIVNKTLEEADACRRVNVPVTTFMLTSDPLLVDFVERFTQANRGRAYYSELDALGSFVLVDYVRNRRRKVR